MFWIWIGIAVMCALPLCALALALVAERHLRDPSKYRRS